jgi:hypothetical protein
MENSSLRTVQKWALAGVLAAGSIALTGCNTAGYHRSGAVAASMQVAATEVQAESEELENVMRGLRQLANGSEDDFRISFHQFSSSLDRLKTAARRTEATGKRMVRKGDVYFESWNKNLETIDYEHIRDLSASRRTEVTNRFAEIDRRYRESQAAVQPLITYLQDIRTALNSDLTQAGIKSLAGVMQNADASAEKVRGALRALSHELVSSSSTLASYTQPAKPEETRTPQ